MPLFDINGLRFNVEQAGSGPPLVLLHGFTGSAESWGEHLALFGAVLHLLRRRSDRPWPDRIAASIRALPHGALCRGSVRALRPARDRADRLLGYSMGGRVALHLALRRPSAFSALVLESASPGMVDAAERAARSSPTKRWPSSIEREGWKPSSTRWEALPLFASQRSLPADVRQRHRDQRLRNNPIGLANSLRGMGAGAMQPVWEHLE